MAKGTKYVKVQGLNELMRKFNHLAGPATKQQIQLFLEKCGMDFLDVVQDQIIAMQVVDTRLLLNSFQPGNGNGIWEIEDGGMTLVVGTNVNYARAVNDGHWTTPKGVKQRWVPGTWKGDTFEYNPGAKTGMLLKRKFVKEQPYWDNAVNIYEKMFGQQFQTLVNHWINQQF